MLRSFKLFMGWKNLGSKQMKKLLGIVVLGLLLSVKAHSFEKKYNLFGIYLADDVLKYEISKEQATDEWKLVGAVRSAVCCRCGLDQPGLTKHNHSTRSNGSIYNQIQKIGQPLIQIRLEILFIVETPNSGTNGNSDC